jgi:hypothetical protein
MKKLILIASFFMMTSYQMYAATGTLTNNSNNPVNVVFYISYTAPTATKSAGGRYGGGQGTLITAGQNYNFPSPNITDIDIFYGNGTLPPLHLASVNTNNSYTINPGSQWTVTQD